MPCLSPRYLSLNALSVKVVCQKCNECRKDKVRDLVGRILAEKHQAVGCHFITLTYGVDRRIDGAVNVKGADVLMYSHFRSYLKKLRNAGYPMRYLVAGEYGPLKQRAHFHAILVWTKKIPPIPKHKRGRDGRHRCWDDPWWQPIGGGHTQYEEVTGKTARYVAKYCLAPEKGKQAIVRRSTRPLLGASYFRHLAKVHVEQGLAPQNRYYTVPGSIEPKSGKLWNYYMNDATARFFVRSFVRQWEERFPGLHPPASDFVQRELDKLAVPKPDPDKPLTARRYLALPHLPTPNGEEVFYDEKRNAYWCELARTEKFRLSSPVVVWWSFDDRGQRCWSFEFVSVTEGERRWKAFLRSRSADEYAAASGRRPR